MPKETAFWDIAHQQLNDDKQLVNGLVESRCRFCGGSTTNGLLEVSMGVTVVELYGLDTTQVVVITSKLGVPCREWERSFRYKLVGLII